jgi:hypothetical protein
MKAYHYNLGFLFMEQVSFRLFYFPTFPYHSPTPDFILQFLKYQFYHQKSNLVI